MGIGALAVHGVEKVQMPGVGNVAGEDVVVSMLEGMGIATGLDLALRVHPGACISAVRGGQACSRAGQARLAGRACVTADGPRPPGTPAVAC